MSKNPNTFSHGQQTISSFFSRKRKSSPIDLTISNDSEDAELLQVKRLKSGKVKSSSSMIRADSGSPEAFTAESSLLKSPAQSSGMQRVSSPSPTDDAVSNNKRKGKGKDNSSSSLREKLRRRDMIKEDKIMSASGTSESLGGFATLYSESKTETASYSAIDLGTSAEDNHLPWEKATSSRQSRKGNSVIGPAGLPCTPLEETVSVTDRN